MAQIPMPALEFRRIGFVLLIKPVNQGDFIAIRKQWLHVLTNEEYQFAFISVWVLTKYKMIVADVQYVPLCSHHKFAVRLNVNFYLIF